MLVRGLGHFEMPLIFLLVFSWPLLAHLAADWNLSRTLRWRNTTCTNHSKQLKMSHHQFCVRSFFEKFQRMICTSTSFPPMTSWAPSSKTTSSFTFSMRPIDLPLSSYKSQSCKNNITIKLWLITLRTTQRPVTSTFPSPSHVLCFLVCIFR